jgi:hypothetical protein
MAAAGAVFAALAGAFAAEARADGGGFVPVRPPSAEPLRFEVAPVASSRGPIACEVPCGWRFEATIPIWVPNVTGTFASGDASIDGDDEPSGAGDLFDRFADATTSLELAFIGRFTARNGPWTLVADGLYASIGETIDWRIRDEDTEGDLSAGIARAYGVWQTRVPLGCDPCSPCLSVGPLVGVRGYYVDLEVDGASGEGVDRTKSWFDAIVGARADLAFAGGTTVSLIADVGTGGSDLTWCVGVEVAIPIGRRWSLLLGWTHLDLDYHSEAGEDFDVDVRLSGPSLGITFRF